ncbi:ABC transporter, ATP-binding protein [[Actinomadura] parvosata subsp. kistnae]|uniref:ABC transporter domain-containing protein n=1 Tax=[Actinomadura] parvosata subsp. kistnae TaxID=1909395 RepID=A0A1U9ZWS5_9ACTN|nr:ATP-binding cassette domain-containing protein [Nonomuraea sp. ATCC 55076]AQZ62405.1 hypothetical protein BKM31_13865 [Nonomuraea sp. ATCC 55076]SPL88622.1 ABC transporter, ATP-binding protein [Actinomadura parvosata subsp. kistnae]
MITQQAPAIQVHGLEKAYKDLRVLRGVDFEVARGSIFALLGSNGAGKTTAVKILSTLLKPDAGTARVNGFDVATQAADVRESISLTGHRPRPAGPQARIEVWQAVKKLAQGGTTVLLASSPCRPPARRCCGRTC